MINLGDKVPKILKAEDIAKLQEGHHTCKPETCGCPCGISYDSDWHGIISRHGRSHPECRCVGAVKRKAMIQLGDKVQYIGTKEQG